jgi:hypothetical protein
MDTRGARPDARTISSLNPGELYGKAIEPLWKRVSIFGGPKEFLQQLLDVCREQGLLFSAHWCMSEVCNGGFHQFFSNPTGVLAPEAIRGFELIDASAVADLARKATALLGSPYPREHERRIAALESILRPGDKRKEWDPFYEFDEKVYAWGGSEKFAATADQYVRSNLDVCFK